MFVNWQKGAQPATFYGNPTFGVIIATERLFGKPQITGGNNDSFGIVSSAKMGWLDLLNILSFPFPSLLH